MNYERQLVGRASRVESQDMLSVGEQSVEEAEVLERTRVLHAHEQFILPESDFDVILSGGKGTPGLSASLNHKLFE